jgi:hypothetical protein
VEVELEEVERVHKFYPATVPFLKLLSTLIHTPKRIPLKDRVVDDEPANTRHSDSRTDFLVLDLSRGSCVRTDPEWRVLASI